MSGSTPFQGELPIRSTYGPVDSQVARKYYHRRQIYVRSTTKFGTENATSAPSLQEMSEHVSSTKLTESQREEFDKAKRLVSQAKGTLRKVNDNIHAFMYPGLEKDLGLDEISSMCDNMHDRIAAQSHEAPPRKPGPVTPLPEYTISIVDTAKAVAEMVDEISRGHNGSGPSTSIYLDLEGYELRKRRHSLHHPNL
jgi:hypothetical protein